MVSPNFSIQPKQIKELKEFIEIVRGEKKNLPKALSKSCSLHAEVIIKKNGN
jgi:hypothetical protein